MKACLVNYNYDPAWLLEYPELEPTIYDRSDDGIERDLTKYGKVFKTKNLGDVDADKLGFLIENYDNLPEAFLWGKSNIHKFVEDNVLRDAIKNQEFKPLLKQSHRIYSDRFGQVNFYQGEMYYERADSWFFNAPSVDAKYFHNWNDWCLNFGLKRESYIPFPPGGNFILTAEKVHRYSRDFYEQMRELLPHAQRPAEAQAAERTYYLLWR